MAHASRLVTADGTSIYLDISSARGAYTGSGTPWTSQATTPFDIAQDETAGPKYTPTAGEPDLIFAGGPPFHNTPRILSESYGTVTEQIVIHCRGTTYTNCVALKTVLENALNTATFSYPCLLKVKPDGAASDLNYEIYHARVQENPLFFNDESGKRLLRAVVTWTRTAWGGTAGTDTSINSATFTNTGTGANNNTQSFGTISGDAITLGQPCEVQMSGGDLASSDTKVIYLASCLTRVYQSRANSLVTSSTTGTDIGASTMAARLEAGVRSHIMARTTGGNSVLEIRAVVSRAASNATTYYTGPWVAGGTTNGALAYLGFFSVPEAIRRYAGTGTSNVSIMIQARSTSGGATTGTLSYIELINAYTWAQVTSGGSSAASQTFLFSRFTDISGGRVLEPPQASDTGRILEVRGSLPRVYSGASLYLAWTAAGVHDTADTITVDATYLPLYRTLGP